MNILFLIFSYNTGGIERLLIDMANELSTRGQHVYLCIINNSYDEVLLQNYDSSITIIKLERPLHTGKRIKYMFELSKIIHEKKIDLIHCQDLNCVLFSFIAKVMSPKLIIYDTVHDTVAFPAYPKAKIIIESFLCKKIIAISYSVKQSICSRGIPSEKVVVIYNAIDITKFSIRFKKDFDTSHIILGNVARIMPSLKGQDILLKAMTILKENYPNILCKFAGKAAPEDEKEFTYLKNYTHTHELDKNVLFCGEIPDVPSFLSSIDIFILPSRHEGFGIALVEAMCMGIPCIASNIDGPSELIKSSSSGLLFETENAYDLANQILYMIEHIKDYNRLSASKYIIDHFSIQSMIDQILFLYLS